MESLSTNPFVFGDHSKHESPKVPRREKLKDCSKPSGVPKWIKSDDKR